MAAKFKIGNTVYLKNEFIRQYNGGARFYSEEEEGYCFDTPQAIPYWIKFQKDDSWEYQLSMSKDIPLTIVRIIGKRYYLANLADENWGKLQEAGGHKIMWRGKRFRGKRLRTYVFDACDIEKRNTNTISLFDLNKGIS